MTYLKRPLLSFEDIRAPRGCQPLDPSSFRAAPPVKNVAPTCETLKSLPKLPDDTIDIWAANNYR